MQFRNTTQFISNAKINVFLKTEQPQPKGTAADYNYICIAIGDDMSTQVKSASILNATKMMAKYSKRVVL